MPVRETYTNLNADLRFILRQLARSPAFCLAAVTTIALGVGANATMFGVVDRLLLRPPTAVRDPQRVMLASVEMTNGSRVATQEVLSFPIFLDIASDSAFRHVAAYASATLSMGSGPTAREVKGMRVTPGYFATLGAQPVAGHLFDPGASPDTPLPAEFVASHAFWKTQLGGAVEAIGRTFELGGTRFRLIGVAPPGFRGTGLETVDAWIPFSTGATTAQIERWKAERQWYNLRVVARLRDGVTQSAAASSASLRLQRAQLRDASSENERQRQSTVRLVSALPRDARGSAAESRVAILVSAMSLFVLILAGANVMNLQLARANRRAREVAIRLALGISRARLLRLLVIESILVGAAGGCAAIAFAILGSGFMKRTLLVGVGGIDGPAIDWRVSAYALGVAIVVGAVIGLVPAISSLRPDLITSLRAGAQPAGSRHGVRRVLLVVQSALAILLLVGTGLFGRSLRRVESLPLGMEPDPVIVIRLNTTGRQYEPKALDEMFTSLERATGDLPDVQSAALTMSLPFGGSTAAPVYIPGRDSLPLTGEGGPYVNVVGADYFTVMGTPMVAGRSFTADDRSGAAPVAIVNETTARLWWPRESPLGKCVQITDPGAPCATIIGVAANARRQSMLEDAFVQLFVPAPQVEWGAPRMIVARLRNDPDVAMGRVQRAVQSALPTLPYVNVERLADRVAARRRSWRLGAMMFSAFGALAIALAAIGLYGVLAYEISQRRREIGIRLALGAAGRQVTGMVVGQGLKLAATGCAIGLVAALAASSRVEPLLFRTSRFDPFVYVSAAAVILVTALLASWLPAWRASRIDPSIVLQSD